MQMAPFAYVTNVSSHTISVIDIATNTVVATPAVDGAPSRIALMPDHSRAYIPTRDVAEDGRIAVLDLKTLAVTSTFLLTDFFIAGIAITPDGSRAYVANSGNDHVVKVLDTATNTVTSAIPMRLSLEVAISPDGALAYVTDFDGVTVVDTATNTISTTIPIDKGSTVTTGRGIAVTHTTAYVTNGGHDTVAVIDTATHDVTTTVDVGLDPVGVAVSPDGRRVFVTNHAGTVSVIDASTNTVVDTITVGTDPFGVAFSPDGSVALVTNSGSDTVSVIDTVTNAVRTEIPVGHQPFGLAIGT
jgi:YVTN family beta-propeller protein